MRSVSCTNSIIFSHNDFPLSRSRKELHEFWKFRGDDETIMFSNYFWAFITSSKDLSNDDFSLIGGLGKGVYESKLGNEYCENFRQDD